MILAIDCGNTRIKWGLHQSGRWRRTGAVLLAEIERLEDDWNRLGAADIVVVANVAGSRVRRQLAAILSGRQPSPVWVKPLLRQCGVKNGYRNPKQLGADRWAALAGARALVKGACLVVMAGTATTADILEADGRFSGGVILPGLDLMKRSLAGSTAGLTNARGRFARRPGSTSDAIETGCLLAQAGAIERMHASLRPGAACVISGGAAARIIPHLRIAAREVDNLVLEGLVRIAREPEQRRGRLA